MIDPEGERSVGPPSPGVAGSPRVQARGSAAGVWPLSDFDGWVERVVRERDAAIAARDEAVAQRDAALEEGVRLRERVEDLERQLAFHQNPHTPPSLRRKTRRALRPEAGARPRGAPKGHRGATREVPPADRVLEVGEPECPKCHAVAGDPVGVNSRVITDLVPPAPPQTTRFELACYQCKGCGHQYEARHPECPKVGQFGVGALVVTALLKFHLRGSVRRVQESLRHHFKLELSTKGVYDLLQRAANACQNHYHETLARVRAAPWVHIDETGFSLDGQRVWLWIFRTPANDILVVLRKSRGQNVVKEVLGEDWRKPVIADGWSGYRHLPILQRCWAHLLRELKEHAPQSPEAALLHEQVRAIFKDLKTAMDQDLTPEERTARKSAFDRQIEDVIDEFSAHDGLDKPLRYLIGGMGEWFTCLEHPGMEPTNNLAEQAIREHVVMRKIMGAFRSEEGAENYQYLASALSGWRLQGHNPFDELEQLLRQQLCLS